MATIETTEGLQTITTSRLALEFRRWSERWAHALLRFDVAGAAFAKTREDVFPHEPAHVPSPTYQDLQMQRRAEGTQALLVGRSGAHHFSAVFTVRETGDDVLIEVDVADRCRAPIETLACTYLVGATSNELRAADDARIVWDFGPGGLLGFEAVEPARVVLAEAGRSASQVQVLAELRHDSSTQRLQYRWRWSPGGHVPQPTPDQPGIPTDGHPANP